MNRIKTISISALLTALLTISGCDSASSDSDSSASTDSSTTPTTEIKDEQPPEGIRTAIIAPDGNHIYTSEITKHIDKNGNETEYSDTNFGTITCDGFAFLSMPDELCYTSIDNANLYNADTMSFSGVPGDKMQDYFRIKVGDSINGLKLTDASSTFNSFNGERSENGTGKYFISSTCTFAGEIELNGYARIVAEDEYGVQTGDIVFVPQGPCPLPVMSYLSDRQLGLYHNYYTYMAEGMTYTNKYGQIFLGNAQTTRADITSLPTDGKFVKVKAVVRDVVINSTVDWFDTIQAEIVTIAVK